MSARLWRLGLLGHPVAHSLSPRLHRAALEALGMRGDYALFDVQEDGLLGLTERLRAGELDGLNVTIPHKEASCQVVDRLMGPAASIGALNTLIRAEDGALEGHNTDVAGLRDALSARWPVLPWRGRPVTVVGAGGAARAAVLAAAESGASEVRVVNRTALRARRLVADLQRGLVCPVTAPGASAAFSGSALVLQASALGMGWSARSDGWRDAVHASTVALREASPDACVYDLVYRPSVTPWIAAAQGLGLACEGGLSMLVAQAAASFTLWTGRRPPLDAMLASLGDDLA